MDLASGPISAEFSDLVPPASATEAAVTLLAPKSVDELEIMTRLSASSSVFNLLPCNLETEIGMNVSLQARSRATV
jgi:hypothetical protein